MDLDIDEIATDLGESLINNILQGASIDAISAALEAGAPIWYQNQLEGISPLHAAVCMQDLNLVKLLIEKGAVWNASA